MVMAVDRLTVRMVERALGEKARAWKGRCFEIASRMVQKGLVEGTAVYGHYLGKVHPKSHFARLNAPFHQHGWIVLKDDLRILDPTRWVFEAVRPYLYLWVPGDDYDEGGNRIRSAFRGAPPAYDETEPLYVINDKTMNTKTWNWVEKYLGLTYEQQEPGTLTRSQLHYLAISDLAELGMHAQPVYEAILKLKKEAFIPIDNLRRVQEGRWMPAPMEGT